MHFNCARMTREMGDVFKRVAVVCSPVASPPTPNIMSDEFLLCEHCLSDNELRAEVVDRGSPIAECKICGHKGGRALPATDERVKRIFRALVRLNFSEWDYNRHLGGESLEDIILRSRSIFNLGDEASVLDFENVFLVLENDWYPATSEGIELGGGYWDGCVLDGLRDRRDLEVEKVVEEAFQRNYFDVIPKVCALIESIRADVTTTLPSGSQFVRGRIGVNARMKVASTLHAMRPSYHYLPFSGADIDSPPLEKATEGRLNRPRVSVLYLASDHQTAVAELRPHPGHLISTSVFRLKNDITIANFAAHDIRSFLSDERLDVLRRILSFADIINLPVQPDQKALYVVTQLFADSIREAGFSAVSFRSSLGPGTNLTCFCRNVFELVSDSEQVHEVTALQYSIIDATTLPRAYAKDKFEPDGDDPFALLVHGMQKRFSQ
jgi:RES domain-containing protein